MKTAGVFISRSGAVHYVVSDIPARSLTLSIEESTGICRDENCSGVEAQRAKERPLWQGEGLIIDKPEEYSWRNNNPYLRRPASSLVNNGVGMVASFNKEKADDKVAEYEHAVIMGEI